MAQKPLSDQALRCSMLATRTKHIQVSLHASSDYNHKPQFTIDWEHLDSGVGRELELSNP